MKNSSKVKKVKFYIAIVVFLPLFGVKCTKTTIEPSPPKTPLEQLPPATQTGAGTFGCLVDGEVFVPRGQMFSSPIGVYYYLDDGKFAIDANNVQDFMPHIYLYLYIKDGVQETGIYKNIIHPERRVLETYSEVNGVITYEIDTLSEYFIEFTRIDLENSIVSGLFKFTAISADKTDTITVSNGRFDRKDLLIQ